MADRREVHELSIFVHGVLSGLHLLGVVYGIKRKNWLDVAAHTFGVAFSVRATVHHTKEAKDDKCTQQAK